MKRAAVLAGATAAAIAASACHGRPARLELASAGALVPGAARALHRPPGPAPITLERSARALQDAFNRDVTRTRLLLLVSPT